MLSKKAIRIICLILAVVLGLSLFGTIIYTTFAI